MVSSFTTLYIIKVLHEAVEHIDEEDFKAETYFANHPNPDVSRLAGMP